MPPWRAQRARELAELEELRPYLDLAREIRADVARAADGAGGVDAMAEAIQRVPARERDRVVLDAFEALTAEEQWAVIERAFGDPEIRRLLAERRAERLEVARRAGLHADVARTARLEHRFDTTLVPVGESLVLGLFREAEVARALDRGRRAAGCARRLVLRAFEPARFRVLEDVFDPTGSYFVTGEYNRDTWHADRLAGHALVRVGSVLPGPDGEPGFEPVVYPGGRVDVETPDGVVQGKLHLGFVVLGDKDIFNDE
jgi:hypothetical protein